MNALASARSRRSASISFGAAILSAGWLLCVSSAIAQAVDWGSVSLIQHSTFQAVNAEGTSAYNPSAFPIRLEGIVLNNNEDYLDPTANFSTTLGDLGGQAQIYVQAVPGTSDFGGTACWMGQNYGNLSWIQEPGDSYQNAAWYGQLDRLGLYHPGTTLSGSQLVRAGDLVEIQAQGGLSYDGQMNVNEEHFNTGQFAFNIVVLQKNYGLPAATPLTLSDLKTSSDAYIFDPTRASGGEHYKSTLVTIDNVRLASTAGWGENAELTLVDPAGRTLPIQLGLDADFLSMTAPTGYFDVTGILNQDSGGTATNAGYQLLALNASDFSTVPEPGTFVLLAAGTLAALFGQITRRRRAAR